MPAPSQVHSLLFLSQLTCASHLYSNRIISPARTDILDFQYDPDGLNIDIFNAKNQTLPKASPWQRNLQKRKTNDGAFDQLYYRLGA